MPAPRTRPIVFTASYGHDELRREARRGELTQLRRGAWVGPRQPDGDRWSRERSELWERCRAIQNSLRSGFAFSHVTCAGLRDWQAPISPQTHIVQAYRAGTTTSADITRHYVPTFSEEDVVYLDGLPVTRPIPTAVACALTCPPPISMTIVDAALRELASVRREDRKGSQVRQEDVREQLVQELASRGRVQHVRRAREIIAFANGFAEFGSESWLRWLVLVQGLPVPELQVPIATIRGIRYPDLMWREDLPEPLLAEYDGVEKYRPDQLRQAPGELVVDQTDREQLLKAATGADVLLRFTRHDKRDPHGAARRLLGAFPPGFPRTPRPLLLARR